MGMQGAQGAQGPTGANGAVTGYAVVKSEGFSLQSSTPTVVASFVPASSTFLDVTAVATVFVNSGTGYEFCGVRTVSSEGSLVSDTPYGYHSGGTGVVTTTGALDAYQGLTVEEVCYGGTGHAKANNPELTATAVDSERMNGLLRHAGRSAAPHNRFARPEAPPAAARNTHNTA